VGFVEFGELLVTGDGVELDVEVEFAQADGAEVLRTGVGFLQVVGAVHQAIEVDAVVQAEHVAGFMGEHLAAALQDNLAIIVGSFLSEKGRIVASEAVDTDTLGEGGLAKDVIPGFGRIEILHGHAEETEGIGREQGFEVIENRDRVELTFLGVVVGTGFEKFFVEGGGREDFYAEFEVGFGIGAQSLDGRADFGGEFTEWKDVDDVADGIGTIETGVRVGVEGLAGFLVHREPVAGLGGADGCEVGVRRQ